MISSGGRFSGGKAAGETITPVHQSGFKTFSASADSEEDYTLSLPNIIFNDASTFFFGVSLAHQPADLFLTQPPAITGLNAENNTVNVRLRIKNAGKGAFQVKLFYTVFGGV